MAAPDDARDAGPGPRLRSARELSGLTQQQAADHLNLDVSVVQALENDDFAALGAPVFAKGHLKRYGASLGLHEEELLDAYERVRARPEDPSLIPRARQEMAPVRSQPNWPWVFGGTALLLLAAGVVAYLSEYGLSLPFGRSPDDGAAQSAQIVAPPGPVAGANGSAESAETAAATVGGESADAAPPVAPLLPLPPGHVSISVAFAADSWAEVYDGSGKAVLYDLGQAGTQRTIAAAAPLSVTFGNAAAVRFYVNGRETAVPAPAPGNTVARFTVQSDGTLRR